MQIKVPKSTHNRGSGGGGDQEPRHMSVSWATRIDHVGESFWGEFQSLALKYQVANLGLGFPTFQAPKFLRDFACDVIGSEDINQYTRSAGAPSLCKALARFYTPLLGREVDALKDVVITVGAAEALHSVTQALLNAGDEAMMFEPFFDFFYYQTVLAGGRAIGIPLHDSPFVDGTSVANDWRVPYDLMEQRVTPRTKLLIVNTPSNPLGKRFSRKELLQLAHFAQRHNLLVVADEVYEHIIYDSLPHVRFAALHLSPDAADTDEDKSAIEYARKSTFTIGSAGKSFSVTGWKIGWIVASSDLATHAWFAHQYNCYTVCTPLQEALARAFDATSQSTAYFRELCTLLERNRDRFIECLRGIKALRVVKPGGAYFVLVDISNVAVRSTCERHCS